MKEFGEGVDRIYRDMAEAGLPEPEYKQSEFMLYATLKNKNWGKEELSLIFLLRCPFKCPFKCPAV